ncbi:Single-stranded DNA-binding protein (fragment) [Desulfamplus magnetovallimortis]|uniref:Single-stranded DNA-binding protein n=1 Tax=Desulfamplus magnetovallimortis TaxID=1246637 RepID=A0A1W1HEM5_9BACT
MNQIILIGNLGQDPEIFFTNEGMQIASFSLAFKSTKDKTNWVKITAFKKTAELVEKYLHKGAKVAVSGMLDQDKWEDDYGNKKSTFKVIANIIEFIKTDGRGFEDNNTENNNPQVPDEDVPF